MKSILNNIVSSVENWVNNLGIKGDQWTVVSAVGYSLLFISIWVCLACTYNYLVDSRILRQKMRQLYDRMDTSEKLRAAYSREQRIIHGKVEKENWQVKLNLKLRHSGVRDLVPWLSVEVYMIINIVATMLNFLLATILFGKMLYSFLIAVATPIAFIAVLSILSIIRYNKTEKNVIAFANIIENFAMTSKDLIDIFDRVSPYMEDPLRTELKRCVTTARTTGDMMLAIEELQENVEYEMFQKLIQNLGITSKCEANYISIIQDCRDMLQTHLRDQRERKQIYRDGRITIIALLGCGALSVRMIADAVDIKGGMIQYLLSSTMGILILVGECLIGLICLYFAFLKGNK